MRPSTCEVATGDRVEILEPRMMQVLVELIEARGRVISRDELIERCWDGVVVGDDAINRVTARLRRLGSDTGTYTLETIRKVGYRLLPTGDDAPAAAATSPRVRSPRRRAAMSRALATAGLALVAAVGFRVGKVPVLAPAPQIRPVSTTAGLALQRLPGHWGPAGCDPSYDLVIRAGRIVMTAPGVRSERRIVAAGDDAILAEGVLPLSDRGKLFDLRPAGDMLTIRDRTTEIGQALNLCQSARH